MDRERAANILNVQPELCREIIRCEVGSSSHGVNLPGTDDFDMMGIGIERPERALGIQQFEHFVYRTAEIREGRKGVPSQAGDIDLTVYSLRKFARMAAQGNPSVLLALYAPALKLDIWGKALRASHQIFQSKNVGRRFLGYMTAQKERLNGERGQMRVSREHLIKEHGYDTKYAMHVLRLGYQGVKYMETGVIECPLEGPMRNFLLGVRRGQQTLESVTQLSEQYEADITTALERSDFPNTPDYDRIDSFISAIYRDVWEHEAL